MSAPAQRTRGASEDMAPDSEESRDRSSSSCRRMCSAWQRKDCCQDRTMQKTAWGMRPPARRRHYL
eukprot:3306335-Rhodomonas_salina.1